MGNLGSLGKAFTGVMHSTGGALSGIGSSFGLLLGSGTYFITVCMLSFCDSLK